MTEYELMKLSEEYDEAIDLSDFTLEELQVLIQNKESNIERLKNKYYDFYDDIKDPTKDKQDW